MAQADSVPSSSRQLITGERANQSTRLRAVKLPAVSIQPVDRHYFIASSDVRVIVDGVPLLWIWRERRPDIELETSNRPGAARLEHRCSLLRDRRFPAEAAAPEHPYSAPDPEQE